MDVIAKPEETWLRWQREDKPLCVVVMLPLRQVSNEYKERFLGILRFVVVYSVLGGPGLLSLA